MFSLGGPFVKINYHFFYGLWKRQDAGDSTIIGNIQNDDDANRLGINTIKIYRSLSAKLLEQSYGLSDSQTNRTSSIESQKPNNLLS